MPEQLSLNIEPCAFCGGPSSLLCDFLFGYAFLFGSAATVDQGRRVINTAVPAFTCDTPFCTVCGKRLSIVHFDGTDKHGRRRGFSDSIDHCLIHRDSVSTGRLISVAQAEEMRAEVRMAITSLRLALV